MRHSMPTVAVLVALLFGRGALSEEAKLADLPKVTPNSADEPLAKEFSLKKTADFLDGVAGGWTRDRKCGTCHTNYPYLISRPTLRTKDEALPVHDEIRKFFEDRVANWDKNKPRWDTEVVATAVCLSLNDAQTTGKLHPLTRTALDRMWTVQQKNGSWDWLKCNWPPMEHDDYFGAVFAAVGVGVAPGDYAKSESAKAGLDKLRAYLKNTAPPDLHHKAVLLWASIKLEGLMTADERQATIKELFAAQQADGGWALPSLGTYKRHSGTANDPKISDGYGTGFTIFILRQAGLPAQDERIQRGITWLKTHQRESGRWFTRSLNNDKTHYIANAGTSYAVLALTACGVEAK